MSNQSLALRVAVLNTSQGAGTRCSTDDACIRSRTRLPPVVAAKIQAACKPAGGTHCMQSIKQRRQGSSIGNVMSSCVSAICKSFPTCWSKKLVLVGACISVVDDGSACHPRGVQQQACRQGLAHGIHITIAGPQLQP